MAVEALAGGHCLLFLAANQREQEKEDWAVRKNRIDEKCPAIVQSIFSFLIKQVERPSKLFFVQSNLKNISIVLKQSLPRLIWGKDEAEAGGCRE